MKPAGRPEVDELCLLVLVDHDVHFLQVPVEDRPVAQEVEGRGHLQQDGQFLLGGEQVLHFF